MSELSRTVRGGFNEDCDYVGDPEFVQMLCAEVERLEGENARLTRVAIEKRNEVLDKFDDFVRALRRPQ